MSWSTKALLEGESMSALYFNYCYYYNLSLGLQQGPTF